MHASTKAYASVLLCFAPALMITACFGSYRTALIVHELDRHGRFVGLCLVDGELSVWVKTGLSAGATGFHRATFEYLSSRPTSELFEAPPWEDRYCEPWLNPFDHTIAPAQDCGGCECRWDKCGLVWMVGWTGPLYTSPYAPIMRTFNVSAPRAPGYHRPDCWVFGASLWWLIMPMAAISLRMIYTHLLRPWRRRRHNQCVGCGYDLRASMGRCPECGAACTAADPAGASPAAGD